MSDGNVRLADQIVPITAVRNHPGRYTALFSRARNEVGYAVCLCRTDQVVRLVIRLRAGRYHLANWPAGGPQHAAGCPWYRSPASMSGRSAYTDAFTTSTDGTSIRLSAPLLVRGVAKPATKKTGSPATDSTPVTTTRQTMGLLALLHLLWEFAQLNVWHPDTGTRSWRTCSALLDEQARDCRINRVALQDALWVVPAFQREHAEELNAAWQRYLDRLTTTKGSRRRGLLLGEIRAVETTTYGVRVRLAHQRASLFASAQLLDRVRRSYPQVFSEHAERADRRQVVLCLIERSRRGYPILIDLAAMLTTRTYIPADSSYEAQMADELVSAHRAFVKPLRYDGEAVFPDFVLVDDDPHTYVEVWGVRGRESYEQRKHVKQALYRESGQRLLEWDVRDPLPELAR